jgi:hypothetical protein
MEKHLTGEVKREAMEKRMLEGSLRDEYDAQAERLAQRKNAGNE